MTLMFDPFAGRQRQQELLQEAATIRLARQAQKRNGTQTNEAQSLRSRMVKLLSGSNHAPSTQVAEQGGTAGAHAR